MSLPHENEQTVIGRGAENGPAVQHGVQPLKTGDGILRYANV
jgi:hypothetical protein